MNDYKDTPSFFNNEEVLKKYLGDTSYYTALRAAIIKLVNLIKPKKVVELGSATGSTTIMLAKKFKTIKFIGTDIREDVVDIAKKTAKSQNLENLSFAVSDMCDFVKNAIDADFVFMLYSFHHILDPLDLKKQFIVDAFNNMKKGSFLCVAETFIPKEIDNSKLDIDRILDLWSTRSKEGYASTYWGSLEGLSADKLRLAKETAEYCSKNESLAGSLVAKRQDEYLVKRSWVSEQGKKAGFSVVINEPVNALGDGVVLLKKE
ncbi:MAG: class I SAM-dependent methyltransferase [Clostridiales bacterium]|nr:class I SAM-dependent methyltransferase [Clostridiales bacterium]